MSINHKLPPNGLWGLASRLAWLSALSTALLVAPIAYGQPNEKDDSPDAQKKAQDKPADKKTDDKKTDDKKSAEKKSDEKKSDAKKSQITAIVGADIYTVTNEIIRRGTILIRDGKILKVGRDLQVPEGAKVIEADGRVVAPGFVAVRMSGIGLGRISGSNKVTDSLDPFDRNLKMMLGVGVTTGCVSTSSSGRGRRFGDPVERFVGLEPLLPGGEEPDWNPDFGPKDAAQCPCCGLPILVINAVTPPKPTPPTPQNSVVIKMSHGQLDGMLLAEKPFYDLGSGQLTGGLNRHNWRYAFAAAHKYLKDLKAHEAAVKAGKKDAKAPAKPVSDDFLKLVQGQTRLRIPAVTASEIAALVELSQELEFQLVIDDAIEAWLVADQLSEADVSVVITPRAPYRPRPGREDRSGAFIENSGTMERAGVPFAIKALTSSISRVGLAGRDLTSLPLEAAFAIRGGASEQKALAALTIEPARMLGLADRIGSIEPGKDADLLILNGPPLDYRTYVEQAMVNGRWCYDRSQDRIYPVFER